MRIISGKDEEKRVKMKNSFELYAFMIIPFFRPMGLEVTTLPFLYYVFFAWEVIAILLFVVIQIKDKTGFVIKCGDKSRFIKYYVLYTFVLSIIMRFVAGNNDIPLGGLMSFCASTFILIYVAREKYDEVIDFFYKYLFWINTINALFIIVPFLNNMLPEGYYFIGHRQAISMAWSLSVFLCLIGNDAHMEKNRKSTLITVLYLVIATFNLFSAMSSVATGIIAIAIFVILYVIMIVFKKFNTINNIVMYLVYIGGLVVNWFIIRLNIQDYFAAFFSTVLGESASLNGRTVIFDAFLKAYNNSKFFGYGYCGVRVSTGWGGGWDALDYAHNTLLQELTNGGIIGFVLFALMGVCAVHNACKTNDLYIKKVILCALAAQIAIMITESINYYKYYMVFLILITYISKKKAYSKRKSIE